MRAAAFFGTLRQQALRLSFDGAQPTNPLTAKGAKEFPQKARKGNIPAGPWFGLTLLRVLTCAAVGRHGGNA